MLLRDLQKCQRLSALALRRCRKASTERNSNALQMLSSQKRQGCLRLPLKQLTLGKSDTCRLDSKTAHSGSPCLWFACTNPIDPSEAFLFISKHRAQLEQCAQERVGTADEYA